VGDGQQHWDDCGFRHWDQLGSCWSGMRLRLGELRLRYMVFLFLLQVHPNKANSRHEGCFSTCNFKSRGGWTFDCPVALYAEHECFCKHRFFDNCYFICLPRAFAFGSEREGKSSRVLVISERIIFTLSEGWQWFGFS